MNLRVLVVDDSGIFRRVIAEVVSSLPGMEVVGTAANGRQALDRVRELNPDLMTLDMELPQMDGLAVLEALRSNEDGPAVIIVSSLTRQGSQLTMRALEKGAFDFITKPDLPNAEQSREALAQELGPRLRALANRLEVRNILRQKPTSPQLGTQVNKITTPPLPGTTRLQEVTARMNRLTTPGKALEMVLIGVSTGGPAALARLLPALPRNLGVPVLIVQHMPPIFTQSLAESLASKCAIGVREAVHGETIRPNTAYLAPGGRQMRLAAGADGAKVVQITDDPPENNCRPAVDYLFRSVANQFPGRSAAVILTGMGSDGTLGLRLLKRHGCFVIAQDEASCVVYGMPKAAVDAGVTDVSLPIEAIAARITQVVQGGAA